MSTASGTSTPELLNPEDLRLVECKVDTWGACACINMDPQARPLREALSPGAELLEGYGVEDLRVYWWKEAIVGCNWKLAQEAFQEAWHVMATHPQLTMGAGEDYPSDGAEVTAFPNGHSRFQARIDESGGVIMTGEGFLESMRLLWEGQDAMILERDLRIFEGVRSRVGPGEDYASAAIAALIDYDSGAGIPLRTTPEAMRLWGGEVYLFPNFFFLPMYSNSLSYRARPYNDDPEMCRFEVWSLTMPPAGEEPGRAELKGRFALDDADNLGTDTAPGLQQHGAPAAGPALEELPAEPTGEPVRGRHQQHAHGGRQVSGWVTAFSAPASR